MKATLEFILPEEKIEYMQTALSSNMAYSLWEITHNLKKECYRFIDDNSNTEGFLYVYDGVDIVFDKISNILFDNGINIDKLQE